MDLYIYANIFIDKFEQNLLRLKKLDYHFWYGFILLTIPSHRITVNPRT